MTLSGIETATFWLVAQCLNQKRHGVPLERTPGTLWLGLWVGPRVSRESFEKKIPCSCRDSKPGQSSPWLVASSYTDYDMQTPTTQQWSLSSYCCKYSEAAMLRTHSAIHPQGHNNQQKPLYKAQLHTSNYFKILVISPASIPCCYLANVRTSKLSRRPYLATVVQNCIHARRAQTFLLFDLPVISCSGTGHTTRNAKFANPKTWRRIASSLRSPADCGCCP